MSAEPEIDELTPRGDNPWDRPFPVGATPDDIYACFRLLLGRNPSAEEWPGHSGFTGSPLADAVKVYLNSLEFHNRRLFQRSLGSVESRDYDGYRIYADSTDGEVGADVLAGSYEPHVAQVFRDLLRPGQHVIDVGANIGFFAMLSAHLVGPTGTVLAIEPNPRNAKLLEGSRQASGFEHLTILQVGASDRQGLLALYRGQSNGTTNRVPDELAELLAAETVPCLPLDQLVDPGKPIALIKVDIEGAEGLALRGAARIIDRDRPSIISEFCPPAIQFISGLSSDQYLGLLTARGYGVKIITRDGLDDCGQDHHRVHAAFVAAGIDHIDLLLEPLAQPGD